MPKNQNVQRFDVDIKRGLSKDQVQERISQDLCNNDVGVKTKSYKQIVFENTFTFFNTLNVCFAVLIFVTGFICQLELINIVKNVFFMGVIFSNMAIGSFQGIRAKMTIDKLSLISAPKATVIRDGEKIVIPTSQIVLDDLLSLVSGNQICSDCTVKEGEVEVNESLLTGESDPVLKKVGDELLSGSFIVSGTCLAIVEHVGDENYAHKIAENAKYLKTNNSQIMSALNKIVKVVGFSIIPVGILLFSKQYFITGDTLDASVFTTVAALIGMIPEGLVLLTSIVFAVSVIRLAKHKTLVQELYCIETLARVDVLCLDKTGTITEGTMQVDEVIPFDNFDQEQMQEALSALAVNLADESPTFVAVQNSVEKSTDLKCKFIVPFSSARKWSGASFENCSYIIGAGEFILGDEFSQIKHEVETYSKNGKRVLLVAKSNKDIIDKEIPDDIEKMGLILISDKIREEAPKTLQYFADQGVDIKIISGDNAVTVANIAKKAGLKNADDYVDATTLKTDEDIAIAIAENSVFGRVTPEQKLKFIKALKEQGHTVAMTGDGVNDVMALKEADCSIAMAAGSDAARNVSNLVLLDSNFASMPLVVQEGRRSINNLQRSATLFLSKTVYSILMSLLFMVITVSYPFEPIQLTIISTITIGIPSFILALETNKERVQGTFLSNVIKKSIPVGLTVFTCICLLCMSYTRFNLTSQEFSTLAVLVTAIASFILLFKLCYPLTTTRTILCGALVASFIVCCVYYQSLFSIITVNVKMLILLIPLALLTVFLIMTITHLTQSSFMEKKKMPDKFQKQLKKLDRSNK